MPKQLASDGYRQIVKLAFKLRMKQDVPLH